MPFERFTKTRSRGHTPKASIWSRGQIGFNQWAVEKFDIREFRYGILFYDRESNKVGVRFTKEQEEGAIGITVRKTGGASISATAFLNFYGIDYSKTRRYDINYDQHNDLYVIQLEDTTDD